MNAEFKTYVFTYSYHGIPYVIEVRAESPAAAKDRLQAAAFYGLYGGELQASIPAGVGSWLPRLICWWKNLRG